VAEDPGGAVMEYKLRALSLGGGVQSSTIAEMVVEGDLPALDLAIFADTEDEPQYVYDQIRYLKGRLASVGIPLVTVSNGGIVSNLLSNKGKFASIPVYVLHQEHRGIMRRQCTKEYKIQPIEKEIRRQLLERGYAKRNKAGAIRVLPGLGVICWIGISLDESIRMKSSRAGWLKHEWPLIDKKMTRLDCANWLDTKGLPVPARSACRICPFHSRESWKNMKDNHPEDWEHVVLVDEFIRSPKAHFVSITRGQLFLYNECIPLKDVDFAADDQQGDFFEICDGYCFI
jgi:hypothetical protein